MRILYVCTANICRSASAQRLLRDAVVDAPELAGVEVLSAGTQARPGSPGCSMAPALDGHAADHRSQALTAELVAWADLILPAARDHRLPILELDARSRARTFTIRQAGRIADWMLDAGIVAAGRERSMWGGDPDAWAGRFAVGDPRRDVAPLPDDPAGRWAWIAAEMDAARGLAGASRRSHAAEGHAVPGEPGARSWGWRGRRSMDGSSALRPPPPDRLPSAGALASDPDHVHADDVPDPHYLGVGLHPLAYEQIRGATGALVRLLREVAAIR